MDQLKQVFDNALGHLRAVSVKLEHYELLTEQDCFGVTSLLAAVSNEQQRCLRQLAEEGVSADDCRTISQLEESLKAFRRKKEEEAHFVQLRQVVQEFSEIRASDPKYQEELSRFQTRLSACTDEKLAEMEAGHELDVYRRFISCVHDQAPDQKEVAGLASVFGFMLSFAILTGGLTHGNKSFSEPSPVSETAYSEEISEPIPERTSIVASDLKSEPSPDLLVEIPEGNIESAVDPIPVAVAKAQAEPQALPATESEPCLVSLQPILKKTAKANAFRNEWRKMPVVTRLLIPALTHFAVLSADLFLEIAELLRWKGLAFRENFPEQVEKALRLLIDKGIVAAYDMEACGTVYCLTPYGDECIHLQSIVKERRLFQVQTSGTTAYDISVGTHRLVAKEQMPKKHLLEAWNDAQLAMAYLRCMERYHSSGLLSDDDLEKTGRSLCWKKDHFQGLVPTEGKFVLCRLCGQELECDDTVLILSEALPASGKENCFACVDHELYRWDGTWKVMTPGIVAEISETQTPESILSSEGVASMPEVPVSENVFIPESVPVSDDEIRPAQEVSVIETETVPEGKEPVAAEVDPGSICARNFAAGLLLTPDQIRTEQLVKLAVQLMAENRFAEAAAMVDILAKAPSAGEGIKNFAQIFRQGAHLPGEKYRYSNDTIIAQQLMQPDEGDPLYVPQRALVFATTLWALIFPSNPYDHNLYNNAGSVIGEAIPGLESEHLILQNMTELLGNELKNLSFENDGLGFSRNILSGLADDGERKNRLKEICAKAHELKTAPTSTVQITGLETCLKQMVGPSSDLGQIISQIQRDERAEVTRIRDYLCDLFGMGDGQIQEEKLEEYIDQSWTRMRRGDARVKVKHLDNDSPARRVCKKALHERLDVIINWLAIAESEIRNIRFSQNRDGYARVLNQLKRSLHQLMEQTSEVCAADQSVQAGRRILNRVAELLLNALQVGETSIENGFNTPLCLTSELMLDENGDVLILSDLYDVRGLEPWMFFLRAVAALPDTPEYILSQIDNYQSERWYRNYGTERLLLHQMGQPLIDRTADIHSAWKAAESYVEEFKSNIRLDRAYGKIQEHMMETVFQVVDMVKLICECNSDFASFYRFLDQVAILLRNEIDSQSNRYRKRTADLEENEKYAGAPIFESIRSALEDENFVRADTYINLLQNGVRAITENERNAETEDNFLAVFQKCEEAYYQECDKRKGAKPSDWAELALRRLGKDYQHWTSGNEKSAAMEWLGNWILGKSAPNTPGRIRNLLTGLGFQVEQVTRNNSGPTAALYELFEVTVQKTSTSLKDYPHPVYKFGTDLSSPMYVVCLFGCKGSSTLIDVMTNQLQLEGATIVLMDGSLTPADRQRVAEKFKADTSGRSPFLLIDRVLLLYLSSLDRGNRQKAMLRCTLPYTFEVLYGTGAGAVPEEMFIGRAREMNLLCSLASPDLVYGGRQLGKTALLNRASKTLNDPSNRRYSFCVDVKDSGIDILLSKTNQRLERLKLLDKPCASLSELCNTLEMAYEEGKIQDLRIFVDECDTLFEEFRHSGEGEREYQAIRPFITLRDGTNHHVKFVFAGTHNVAATESAEQENSNLIHVKNVLCIEPLSNDDAIKLICRPMSYLGFEVEQKQIELILSNTNSYPGLIHMFCNALIRSVCRDYTRYYSGYRKGENPPYRISDEQMRAVFKENDIRKEIGTRVMATIRLNRRYHVVSCLLAQMIYEDMEHDRSRLYGYSPRELLSYNASGLNIPLILSMQEKDIHVLLDEMVHMGILWKNDETDQYRFRQQDFLSYIGSDEDVIAELLKAAEER